MRKRKKSTMAVEGGGDVTNKFEVHKEFSEFKEEISASMQSDKKNEDGTPSYSY